MAKKKDDAEPVVNKYTSKVTQDGVELTWNMEGKGDVSAQVASDFYVESVNALQKFKKADPRTEPKLRALVKTIKRVIGTVCALIVLGILVVAAYEAGASQMLHGAGVQRWLPSERWSAPGWHEDRDHRSWRSD